MVRFQTENVLETCRLIEKAIVLNSEHIGMFFGSEIGSYMRIG